ncbi:Utp14 protein-domain-containing protein [Neohortaea acidophila]|uniref:Utp14 protein-domain-containing protein n=1 Tax=Neohortaea acidophila TaxID=245834 RepID=A0A6A6PF90_9PEZI|nr:Utp14 protein-domain-containing protein [Neohortaea acidophila]KAF2478436.1 Utp14 protein-domain-containing protein [Neohortaea acidophila]
MPPRIARSTVSVSAPKKARDKNRKRNLNAYSIASHSVPSGSGIRQHRLGEYLDDAPRPKRPRVEEGSGEEHSDEDAADTKRRRRTGDGGDVEEGSDSEGNEWTLGALREDDNDSELDSDDAFGESDEERFAGFTFRGSSSQRSKHKATARPKRRGEKDNTGESALDFDDGSEDDLEDEGVDLATMLDEEQEGVLDGDGDGDGESEDEELGTDSSSDSDEESDGEQDEEERLARMRDRLEALDPAQQHAPPSTTPQHSTLTVEDLLADLDPDARDQFAAPFKAHKKSEQSKTLSAPLPSRQQGKLNREVASKKAKEQLDRWKDTVMHNRRAEFLAFPLQNPDEGEAVGKDTFVQSLPQNELEENIRRIMEESGMVSKLDRNVDDAEEALLAGEELAEKQMPVQDVVRRRAELRRARDLLFREEIKAKRIAKIKSKSYRRVHRKERQRLAEREREQEGEGSDEDAIQRADRLRAESRMNTKHRDSKWAKSLKATNRTVWDDDARDGVQEQARRHEELRRRIAGDAIDEDEDAEDQILSDGSDDDAMAIQLDNLDESHQHDIGEEEGRKGVAGMKFMRAAEARQRKQNEEDIERMKREFAMQSGDDEDERDDELAQDQGLGRAVFGPKPTEDGAIVKTKRPELEEGDKSDESGEDQGPAVVKSNAPKSAVQRERYKAGGVRASNSTSASSVTQAKRTRSKDHPDEGLLDLTEHASGDKKIERSRTKAQPTHEKPATTRAGDDSNGWTVVQHEAGDEQQESQSPQTNPILSQAEQNDLLKHRAFAGADVKTDFDAEKAALVVSEDEKEIDTHLPGWGSWTGEGLSKGVRKANNRQRHNPLYKTKLAGVKADDRKDARLENVLISEKQDRKGKKYKADMLPHQYEKKEQYERSLRVPVGPEWVTKATFQKNTKPRVVVKPGAVVRPMERPLI